MKKDRKIENFLKLQQNIENVFSMYNLNNGASRWEMQELIKELIQYKCLNIEDVKSMSNKQLETSVLIEISKYAQQMQEDKVQRHLWRVQNFILEQGNKIRVRKILEEKVIKYLDSLSMKEAQNLGDINQDILNGNYKLVRDEYEKELEEFVRDLEVDVIE